MADENWTDEDLERIAGEMLGLDDEPAPDTSIIDLAVDPTDDFDLDLDPDDEAADSASPLTEAVSSDEEGVGEPTPAAPSSAPDATTATGALDPATLLSYAQFDAILKARPDARQFFEDMLGGRAQVPAPAPTATPAPPVPALPELDDDALADPAIRALYDTNRATLEALAAERARVDALTQVTTHRTQQELTASALAAKAEFAASHNIDPAKVEDIARHADNMGISQALLANATDFKTAVTNALDTAYWSMPEFRKQALEDQVRERTAKNRKRQKLAAVGGGGGVANRDTSTDPRQLTDAQRRDAMIRDVADQWFGQTQSVE